MKMKNLNTEWILDPGKCLHWLLCVGAPDKKPVWRAWSHFLFVLNVAAKEMMQC